MTSEVEIPTWATAVPNYPVHTEPARTGGDILPPFTWQQMQEYFDQFMNAFLAQVAIALGGIEIAGWKPFEFLVAWGENSLQTGDPLNAEDLFNLIAADLIPGLDATKIISGEFAQDMITDLEDDLNSIWDALLSGDPQALIDAIVKAMGGPVSGNDSDDVTYWLTKIPGVNIASALLASVIPALDASKIVSGEFAQDMITDLEDDLDGIWDALVSGDPQQLIDAIVKAMGGPVTGNDSDDVLYWLTKIPGANIASALLASVIPGLDATKIVSGLLNLAQVPGLPTSKITSGVFGAGLIPSLDASKIVSGLLALAQIPNLDVGRIPSLPAGQITSGIFGAGLIPSLDASKIVSGLLALAQIPALDVGRIPSLPAGQITSGIFGAGLIPSLDASKIVSGLLALAQIPSLPAGQITSGMFGAGQIPLLDASKIGSGIFAQSMVTGLTTIHNTLIYTRGAGSNLVHDPLFETTTLWGGPAGTWDGVFSTAQKHSGSQSRMFTLPAGLAQQAFVVTYDPLNNTIDYIRCKPGDKFYMECWYYVPASNGSPPNTFRLAAGLSDSTGVNANTYPVITNVSPGVRGVWTKVTGYLTIPAGYDKCWFYFVTNAGSGTAGDLVYFDDPIVREVTEPQTITQQLYGGTSVLANILAASVPGLDATKIISGALGLAQIPGLPAGQITSGIFGAGQIPSLDASKIVSGLLALAQIPALDVGRIPSLPAGQITSGIFGAGLIPSLDASKIVSGLLALAQIPALDVGRIPSLPAGQITSGIFGAGLIPSLDASKIVSGLLALAQIPALDVGRIPSLPAGQITSGVFGAGMIPSLDASKIVSGLLALAQIPNLDAAKITSGAFDRARIGVQDFENLAAGSDFETTNPWLLGTGWSIAADQSHSGTQSLKHVGGPTGSSPLKGTFEVKPGDKFYMELWARRDSAYNGADGNCKLRVADQAGGLIGQLSWGTGTLTAADTWTKVSVTLTAPAGATAMTYTCQDNATAGNVWIDDIVIRRVNPIDTIPMLIASLIPSLDASKIVSGLLALGQIPGLPAGQITSGIFGAGMIPSLDASKIVSGLLALAQIPALDVGRIPSLPAGQITSGIFGAGLIPSLDASKIVSGLLALAQIPALDVGRIPSLPAGQITSGIFGAGLIPSLDASKIVSGLLALAQIPGLPAGQITSGIFGTPQIPALDASKITSGTFAQSMVTNLATDLSNRLLTNVFNQKTNAPPSNLVISPDFEDTTIGRYATATFLGTYSTEQAHGGGTSYKLTMPAGAASGTFYLQGMPGPPASIVKVQPGQKYFGEIWGYAPATNAGSHVMLIAAVFDSKGVLPVTYPTFADVHLTKGTWTRMSGYVTIPAGYDQAQFIISVRADNTGGDLFYFDDATIREETAAQTIINQLYGGTGVLANILAASVPSLDASKIVSGLLALAQVPNLPAGQITSGIFGTPQIPALDASKITSGTFAQTMVTGLVSAITGAGVMGTNLVISPDMEDTTILRPVTTSGATVAYSAAAKRNGAYSLLCTQAGAATACGAWLLPISTTSAGASNMLRVAPGQKFYLEAWVQGSAANSGGGTSYLYATCVDSNAVNAITYPTAMTISGAILKSTAGTWNKLSGYVTVPAGYDRLGASISLQGGSATNDVLYVDDVICREETAAQSIISQLYGGTTVLTNILAAAVPSLDASKIVSGLLALAQIPGLPAGQITSGIFGATQIPGLDASKIVSGVLAQTFVTGLPALTKAFSQSFAAGSNLVQDPQLENPTLWNLATSGGGGAFSTAQKHSGAQSVMFTVRADLSSQYIWMTQDASVGGTYVNIRCKPGDKYYAEAWYFVPVTNGAVANGVQLGAYAEDSTGVIVGAASLLTVTINPAVRGAWTKMSGYFTIPPGYDLFRTYVRGSNTGSGSPGDVSYVDDLMLREVTEAQNITQQLYGGTSVLTNILAAAVPSLDASKIVSGLLALAQVPNLPAGQITSGIFGTPQIPALDASKITSGTFAQSMITNLVADLGSRLLSSIFNAAATAGSNLVIGPTFEDATIARIKYSGNPVGYSTEQAHSGTQSYKWTHDSSAGNSGIYLAPSTIDTIYRVRPGDRYYIEAWVHPHASNVVNNATINIFARLTDSTGTLANAFIPGTSIQQNLPAMAAGQWNKIACYAIIPAGYDGLAPGILAAAATTIGNVFYLDDVMVREVTEAQNITQQLYGGTSVLTNILAAAVPSLDASKIVSGLLALGQIPNLPAGQITSGIFGATQIPTLDASKIVSGLLALAQIPALDVGRIPNLPAAQITSGIFGATQIPTLDASKIVSGLLQLAQIPGLDVGRIPNLPASQITSGQFPATQIPTLDASKIVTGLFGIGRIPTGDINRSNVFDLGSMIDNVTNALVGAGQQFSGTDVTQARGSMDRIYNDTLINTQSIQTLRSDQAATEVSGVSVNVNFNTYPDGALPSMFTVVYSGAGTSALGVTNGQAGWRSANNDGNRTAIISYNVAPTNTDFQIVRGTLASAPPGSSSGGTPRIWAMGRVDNPANPQNYVWARGYCTGFLTYRGDIGCTVAGVETVWASNIPLTWSMDINMVVGASANPRRYQVYSGTTLVYDYTEVGTASMLGAGYRYWGCRTEIKTGSFGANPSPSIASTSVSDNAPPVSVGSGCILQRSSTGGLALGTASSTGRVLPNGMFDTNVRSTADYGVNLTTGSIAVTNAGWYLVTGRANKVSGAGWAFPGFVFQLWKNGARYQDSPQADVMIDNSNYSPNLGGAWIVYADAGDVLQLGFAKANTGINNPSVNGAASQITFFNVSLMNRSLA